MNTDTHMVELEISQPVAKIATMIHAVPSTNTIKEDAMIST